MLEIPENYTGVLTFGTTNELSQALTIDFTKGNNTKLTISGTTDGAGVLSATIDADTSEFFSDQYPGPVCCS